MSGPRCACRARCGRNGGAHALRRHRRARHAVVPMQHALPFYAPRGAAIMTGSDKDGTEEAQR
eukprot:7743203-Alexandrium_andersonii.AAC.1